MFIEKTQICTAGECSIFLSRHACDDQFIRSDESTTLRDRSFRRRAGVLENAPRARARFSSRSSGFTVHVSVSAIDEEQLVKQIATGTIDRPTDPKSVNMCGRNESLTAQI